MEGGVGKIVNGARNFAAQFYKSPFDRLRDGQMSEKELVRRSGGADAVIRRLGVAKDASKNFTPDMTDAQKIERIREALRKPPKNKS